MWGVKIIDTAKTLNKHYSIYTATEYVWPLNKRPVMNPAFNST